MSYKQAVLRDNPLGFWLLDGPSTLRTYGTLLLEYATYQEYLDNEQTYLQELNSMYLQDVSAYQNNYNSSTGFGGNSAAYTLGSPNFQDVMTLITHANYDSQNNGCRITDNIGVDILNIYKGFEAGYEKKNFGIEFWALIQSPPTVDFPLVSLKSGSNNRMRIYINGDSIYFQVYFSNGTSSTTKKQILSWDRPFHVFAIAKDDSVKIYVNALSDETVSFTSSLSYYTDPGNPTNNQSLSYYDSIDHSRFCIGPAASGKHFTVNGLALYDYELSVNQMKGHMFWAHRDSDPINYSKQTNASNFLFDRNVGQLIFSKKLSSSPAYNTGVFSNVITDKSGITLAQTTTSQAGVGTWEYTFTAASYTDFANINLAWDSGSSQDSTVSSKYVKVEVSYDLGATFYQVTNGKNFPYFMSLYSSAIGVMVLIKVTLFSQDTSLSNQPRLDNLAINLYADISEVSDSGLFKISPTTSSTYIIKTDDTNILSRSSNLGIRFSAQDPGGTPGSAVISSIAGSSYESIEFWFQYNGTGGAVLDIGSTTPDLYVDSNNVLNKGYPTGYLYVNGVDRSSSPATLVNGEIYHVVVVYSGLQSHDILINGSYNNSYSPSDAGYGYITIYPSQLSSSQVQTRYLSFISVTTGIARDSVTSLGSIMEYSGSPTNINDGQPIGFHRHIN
jgi:hypothetical protein